MKKAVMLSIFFTLLLLAINSMAATFTSVGAGNWSDRTKWLVGGSTPAAGPTFADIVIINHAIVFDAGSYSAYGTAGSITIQNGGSLKRTGDLNLTGTQINIIVSNTGSGNAFQVTGNLTMDGSAMLRANGGTITTTNTTLNNQSRITMAGGNMSVASLNLPDYQNSGLYWTAGTLAVSANLTIGQSETFQYPTALVIPGNLSVANGGSITATSLGGTSLSVTNSSKVTLTSGSVTLSTLTLTGTNSELNIAGASVNVSTALTLNSKLNLTSGSFSSTNSLTIGSNGALVEAAGTTLVANSLSMTAGTFSASGTTSIATTFTLNGGQYASSVGSTTTTGNVSVTNSGGTLLTNNGTFNVTGNVTHGGTITNNGTMDVTGNYSGDGSGASVTNNYGSLTVHGNMVMPSGSKHFIFPGAMTTVDMDVTTTSNQNLVVGTNVNPPPYADMVIKGNLRATGSGDVLVDKNGRLALYGNFVSDGGGNADFTVNNGGQVYINGTSTFNGGGDNLTNNNTGVPYGVYSNNQPTYPGGGNSNGAAGANSVQSVATMQTQNPSFYTWVASQPGSPLPVELVFFKVESTDDRGINLAWQTSVEKNFDRFEIEHAGEDLQFIKVGTLKGKGGNLITDYSFSDNTPNSGSNYYRLKSIDFDGAYKYSNVVRASWSGMTQGVSLYPNPVLDHSFKIEIDDKFNSPVTVSVLESRGYLVYSAQFKGTSESVTLPDNLSAGIYFVKITSASQQQTVRIVVN